MDLDTLRETLLQAEESRATRVLAVGLAAGLLVFVLTLVRRRVLREEYTPIWVAASAGVLLACLNLDWLRGFARLIGAWTVSSTLYFLALVFLGFICLNYAVRLSKHSVQLKNLAQETAILRARLERLDPDLARDLPPREER